MKSRREPGISDPDVAAQAARKKASVRWHAQPVEKKKGLRKLAGEGPVKGFALDLTAIWEGL